jgi:hypothetical protein
MTSHLYNFIKKFMFSLENINCFKIGPFPTWKGMVEGRSKDYRLSFPNMNTKNIMSCSIH